MGHKTIECRNKIKDEKHQTNLTEEDLVAMVTEVNMVEDHTSPNFISPSLSRDPLLFLSLSLDLFSSSLPPIHRRSTVSPPSPPSLTKAWTSRLSSFSSYFLRFCNLGLLRNHTKALCLSAGAGHAPMAMAQIGLSDVTAVELVDSLPLVRRADPHNLSFFDGAFDFAFTAYLDDALFPWRVVEEMERTVRRGGFCVVAVDECGGDDVREIARLFLKSKLVDVANVTIEGSKRTSILLKVQDFKT
ncbi:uncharacterized protein LOC106447824 [Brassica napus]|uniref:uncharacterized protein LOC106447824 n=1 Tax=Brassica napus TaxID=3708 RepID=UPI00207856D7|nr:uncharacterized protein LOC106447824 [Brassica napus]